MRLFRKIFDCIKGSRFNFMTFCNRMKGSFKASFNFYKERNVLRAQRTPRVFGTMRHFPNEKNPIFKKIFVVWKSGFRVLSSMKCTLWVSHLFSRLFMKMFWHILETLRFLSFRYSANFGRSQLVLPFPNTPDLLTGKKGVKEASHDKWDCQALCHVIAISGLFKHA